MGKRRIIVPNPKIEKNDIGKKDKKFNDIYTNNIETVNISTDNINTEKINGEIIDEERYLENQFTIIYPGGGDAENPGIIKTNSKYICENPFPGYYVYCLAELYTGNEWGFTNWTSWYNGGYIASGVSVAQHNDNTIVLTSGINSLINNLTYEKILDGYTWNNMPNSLFQLPCRIKIWKVGKIK